MKPVIHDQEDANSRGEAQDSLLRETVWLDHAVLESSHEVLLLLSTTVQWS